VPLLTSAQVVINTRTLRIGDQTYSLGNIARVQVVKLAKPSRADKGDAARAVLAGCAGCGFYLLFGIVGGSIGALIGGATSGTLIVIGGFLALVLMRIVYEKTKEPYLPRYALMLETTGNPKISLVSTDKAELERLSVHIANAMENPPEAEQVYTVHNVISGDQYNLVGDHNIGKWEIS